MDTDAYRKARANQTAIAGAISAPAGLSFFQELHNTLVVYFPDAPDSLWNVLFYALALVLGGGLGKLVRSYET